MSAAGDVLDPAARRARPVGEVAVVLGVPVLLALAGTQWSAVATGAPALEVSDAALLATLAAEAVLAAAMVPWLRRRGWSPAAVSGDPRPVDVLRGAGLWLATIAAVSVAFLPVYLSAPGWAMSLAEQRLLGGISLPVLVLAAVWNSVFEEFLWLGYGVTALAPRLGMGWACAVSILLRVSIHAYQGLAGMVLGVLPVALVLTWYFARTGRLWPAVVAHVVTNALAFAPYVDAA